MSAYKVLYSHLASTPSFAEELEGAFPLSNLLPAVTSICLRLSPFGLNFAVILAGWAFTSTDVTKLESVVMFFASISAYTLILTSFL